jgi:cytochrome P450
MNIFKYINRAINEPVVLRTELFRKYGDISEKVTLGKKSIYIGSPKFVNSILGDNQDNYFNRSPLLRQLFSPFIGNDNLLFITDLERWSKDRSIANMSFDEKVYFNDYSKTIITLTDQMLNKWNKEATLFDVQEEIDILLINVIANTLLIHLDIPSIPEFTILLQNVIVEVKTKIRFIVKPLWHLFPASTRYKRLLTAIRNLIINILNARLKQNKQWDDLFDHFLQEYKHLKKEEMYETIGHQVAAFLVAGFFTTAGLINWTLVHLSQHPTVSRNILQELDKVIGSRLPEYNDLKELPYLSCVIKEILRYNPPSHALMRESIEDDEIDGYFIPKKTNIILSVSHIHRHKDFWENPDGFDPMRFMNNPLGQKDEFAYIPFGAGKRKCVAAAFATLEAMLIIPMILQRFQISLPPHSNPQLFVTTVITNRPNIKMMLRKSRS